MNRIELNNIIKSIKDTVKNVSLIDIIDEALSDLSDKEIIYLIDLKLDNKSIIFNNKNGNETISITIKNKHDNIDTEIWFEDDLEDYTIFIYKDFRYHIWKRDVNYVEEFISTFKQLIHEEL